MTSMSSYQPKQEVFPLAMFLPALVLRHVRYVRKMFPYRNVHLIWSDGNQIGCHSFDCLLEKSILLSLLLIEGK